MKLRTTIIVLLLGVLVACNNNKTRHVTQQDIQRFEEKNIQINKEIVKLKQDTIKQFIQEHKLDMKPTGSGVWYHITPSNDTTPIKTGDIIQIAYSISLLNGTQCYSSDSLGLKEFKVGQGGVESGLEEVVLLMHKGDSANLLIPPHRAYGLVGDQNKIPFLAILYYRVSIKNHWSKKTFIK